MNPTLIALLGKFTTSEAIRPASRLKEDLGLDSIQLVRLAVELEDTFGVTIPDEAIPRLYTVSDVEDYLTKRGPDAWNTTSI